jgi:hypothetical protein
MSAFCSPHYPHSKTRTGLGPEGGAEKQPARASDSYRQPGRHGTHLREGFAPGRLLGGNFFVGVPGRIRRWSQSVTFTRFRGIWLGREQQVWPKKPSSPWGEK